MRNKFTLTLICFFANFIIAGFACQFGMLVQPIASYFHQNIQHVVPIFSLLHLGAILGTLIGYFLIDKVGIKFISILCYLIIFSCAFYLYFTQVFLIAALCLVLVGIGGGVSLCIAGTLLVTLWQGRIQSTLLVMQDLVFNSAGILFPMLTTYALTHELRWSFSYFLAAILCVVVIILISISRFDANWVKPNKKPAHPPTLTRWNHRIILSGLILFISMLALYAFLTWMPLFISHKFGVSFIKSGTLITQYWSAAILGSLLCSLLATRINVRILLLLSMGCATLCTYWLFTTSQINQIALLVWLYGLSCAAPYNIFIAYGASFLAQPSSKNISYILFSGALGSMLSPLISAGIEHYYGLQLMVLSVPLCYVIVSLLIIISCIKNKPLSASTRVC